MVRYSACVLSFPIVFSEMGGDYAIESVCFFVCAISVCIYVCLSDSMPHGPISRTRIRLEMPHQAAVEQ